MTMTSTSSTPEVSNDVLWQMFDGIRLVASKRRGSNHRACDFFHLTTDQQIEEFNARILPLWQEMGCPEIFKPGYLEFERAIFAE
jgi:hypothetical protein